MPMPARNCSWLSTNDSELSAQWLIRAAAHGVNGAVRVG